MDIALKRAAYNGCKIAIGSATPSVESYKKALEGVYELVKMPERINKKPLPEEKTEEAVIGWLRGLSAR